jgi:hypothetical protein
MVDLPVRMEGLRAQLAGLQQFIVEKRVEFETSPYEVYTHSPRQAATTQGFGTETRDSAIIPGTLGVFLSRALTSAEQHKRSAARHCAAA